MKQSKSREGKILFVAGITSQKALIVAWDKIDNKILPEI